MSDTDSTPPAQKVTKDEIVAAIKEICETTGVPVVRIDDIVGLDSIEAGDQTITNHLDELVEMGRVSHLEYGQKGVWWVPEDEGAGENVDVSAIDWESRDPTDIPEWLLEEHPDFQDPTYWEGMANNWGTVAVGSLIIMTLGVLVLVILQNTPVQLGVNIENGIGLIIIGSIAVAILGFGVVLIARVGQLLENRGLISPIRNRIRGAKMAIIKKIENRLPETED